MARRDDFLLWAELLSSSSSPVALAANDSLVLTDTAQLESNSVLVVNDSIALHDTADLISNAVLSVNDTLSINDN